MSGKTRLKILVFLSASVFPAAVALAVSTATPHLFNYQGRLTDATGTPLSDGAHSVRMIIWNDPTATNPLNIVWDSGPLTVTTDKGLFTIQLGASPQPAMDPNSFLDSSRWLGITVGADPEISPRTRLVSVAYAFTAQNAVTAGTANVAPNYLPLVGGTMTGVTLHDTASSRWQQSGQDRVIITPTGNGYGGSGAQISTYGSDNQEQIRLWGGVWGELLLHNSTTANPATAYLSAYGFGPVFGSGTLQLSDSTGNNKISLDASYNGDASVVLPDNAVDSREILDEPGIASAQSTNFTDLTTSSAVDILTVTITIPAPGYVVVDGKCYGITGGTLSAAIGYVQIDSVAGGSSLVPYWTVFGANGFSNTSTAFYPSTVYRVFYESAAGTYTFRLEGGNSGTSAGAIIRVGYPMIRATYYPTSYGSVMTLTNATTASQFQQATAVPVNGITGNPTGQTMYQVDLRELEVKAANARAEAEKLERQLAEAKMQQMRQQLGQSSAK